MPTYHVILDNLFCEGRLDTEDPLIVEQVVHVRPLKVLRRLVVDVVDHKDTHEGRPQHQLVTRIVLRNNKNEGMRWKKISFSVCLQKQTDTTKKKGGNFGQWWIVVKS